MENGLNGKFVKTATAGSEERLHTLKIDEIITAYNKVIADYSALRTKFVALLVKLDADTGLDESDYAATLTPAAATSASIAKTATQQLIPSPVQEDI